MKSSIAFCTAALIFLGGTSTVESQEAIAPETEVAPGAATSSTSQSSEVVTVDLGSTEPTDEFMEAEPMLVQKRSTQRNYTQRGLTMPRLSLRADLSFTVFNTSPIDWANDFSTNLMMQVGGAFSITDDLEVGLSSYRMGATRFPPAFRDFPPATLSGLIGIRFTNGIDFGDIPIWGRYRVLNKEKFQLAVELGLQIPTNTRFGLWLSVPMRITPSKSVAIDTGVEFAFNVSPFQSTLNVPLAANFRIIEGLYAGIKTGLGIYDFAELYVPLGAQVGYTLGLSEQNNPLLDLELAFLWPNFIATGNTDALQATWWSLGLNARFYYTL